MNEISSLITNQKENKRIPKSKKRGRPRIPETSKRQRRVTYSQEVYKELAFLRNIDSSYRVEDAMRRVSSNHRDKPSLATLKKDWRKFGGANAVEILAELLARFD